MTKEMIEKFAQVAKDLSESASDLVLFALLQRSRANGKWDVIVAAPWADETLDTYRYIATQLKHVLAPADMLSLSRIVLLHPEEPAVHDIADATASTRGKLLPFTLNGMHIREGYIFHRSPAS